MQIGEPSLGLSTKDYFFNKEHKKLRQAYVKYLTNVAVLLGADVTTAKEDIEDLFEFETLMANVRYLLVFSQRHFLEISF